MLQIILHSGFLCLLKHIFGWFVVTTQHSLVLFCCQHVSYSVNRKFGSKFSILGSNHSASAAHSGLNLQRNLFFLEGVSAGPETDRFLSFDAILEWIKLTQTSFYNVITWEHCSGADPGIFVRGVQLSGNFDKQKKKKKQKKNGLNQFSRQLFAYKLVFFWGGGGVRAWHVPLYKYTDDMVDLILYMYMCLGWGVWGSSPRKFSA